MTRLRTLLSRLMTLLRKGRLEQEMDEELRFHLEKQIEDSIKAGMSPQEGRRAALVSFGGVEQTKEKCRDIRAARWIEEVWQDLRYGLRVLRKNPGFTTVAVFSLGLGIGANTAVFSLVDILMFRPFPVQEPNRLAVFTSATSYPDYLDYRDWNKVFTGLTAFRRFAFRLNNGESTEQVEGESVSANYFAVLGLELPMGRSFLPVEDEAPGSHPVAILSYGLWQRSFGVDPMILGKTIKLNSESLTIVGVAPKSFRGTEPYGPPIDIWIPLSMVEDVMHFKSDPNWHDVLRRRDARWLGVTGRLKLGTTLEQAQAAMTVLARQMETSYGKPNWGSGVRLSPLGGVRIPPKSIRLSLALLVTIAGFVLLIVCANLANLLVARACVRQREIAIRQALGASRARLARQLLTESVVLSSLGMALGFVVSVWTMDLISNFNAPINPGDLGFSIDGRVFGIALMTALVPCITFGLVPAIHASQSELQSALQRLGFAFRRGRQTSRFRKSLVVFQVATSVILLVGAGLLLRTLWNLQNVDPGFEREDLFILSVDLNTLKHGYDETKGMTVYRIVLERVRGLPGVRSVAWAGDAPLAPIHHREHLVPEHQATTRESNWIETECNIVTPRYFEMLGVPLLRGRDFNEHDDEAAPGVVIINETMAARYWPGVDPIGKRIRVRGRARELYEVVGVVKAAKYRTLWEDPKPYAYFPLYQRYYSTSTLHFKAAGNPRPLLARVRQEIEGVNSDVTVSHARPLSEQFAVSLSQQRLAATLLGISGILALVLALVGVYGVMAYSVAQRTQEIGIRIALGARQKDVLRHIFKEGIILVLVGLSVGVPVAFVLSRFLASWIYGMGRSDPITYAAISLLLMSTAAMAIYLPARRASRVDPMVALRYE